MSTSTDKVPSPCSVCPTYADRVAREKANLWKWRVAILPLLLALVVCSVSLGKGDGDWLYFAGTLLLAAVSWFLIRFWHLEQKEGL